MGTEWGLCLMEKLRRGPENQKGLYCFLKRASERPRLVFLVCFIVIFNLCLCFSLSHAGGDLIAEKVIIISHY